MKLKISYKHMKHSSAIDERIQEKSEKFKKFYDGDISMQWVCWVHENEHWSMVKVHGPKFDFSAKACADNMYKSLDMTMEKMERQLDKQKEQGKNKIHASHKLTPKYTEMMKQVLEEEKVTFEDWDEKSA
ncbi:MAG TPA: ribosome-associated translation inhibitor RaiA [Bacteriovoracaceae bacterium]|nr:ribosome-associated translation inhibitor RaiA [Bacteriovoracaceae bacterium]